MKSIKGIEKCSEINDLSQENEIQHKMASKTNGVTQYKIKLGKGKFVICDTPGFGDTRGSTVD